MASISIIYAAVSLISLILIGCYGAFIKRKDIWLMLLYVSVFVVNLGYFSISISTSLNEALLANRISYLGSVFLPLCMMMSIANVCKLKVRKEIVTVLIVVSVGVFLLAASPGYSDLYYKAVTFEATDGVGRLIKTYGSLHIIYLIYLVSYFVSMIAIIFYSAVRKKISSHKYASMLTAVVFLNIIIWFLEQIIDVEFEFLSVSYIASEIILLFLCSIIQDYVELKENKGAAESNLSEKADETKSSEDQLSQIEQFSQNDQSSHSDQEDLCLSRQLPLILELWSPEDALTSREAEVLSLIFDNYKRREIAQKLCLSENTVKTHTSHIFTKLSVSGKTELFEKAENLLKRLNN